MKLGKLEKIDLREQWKNEATEFTPWLAKEENIKLLADELNIEELEVINKEENVGPFRADILCRDTLTDNYVVVENQLERTDHSHLGQIITYSSGLEANTIIWIAKEFTEEHRAALDWLNEITPDNVNFFGVEIELWKIGESDAAPKFKIVSKPNNWTKNVRKSALSDKVSENGEFRLEYWTALNEYFKSKGKQIFKTDHKPSTNHWMSFSIGKSGIHTSIDIIKKDNKIRVGLWFVGEKSKENFDKMIENCGEDIKNNFDGVAVNRMDGAEKTASISIFKETDPTDRTLWNEQHEWMRENLEKFHKYFKPKIQKLY